MNITTVKNTIVPLLEVFCGVPVIVADDLGEKPEGPHITYKVTLAKTKGVGRPNEEFVESETDLQIKETNEIRSTISFTAYALNDDDLSRTIAETAYSWFEFYGYETLSSLNVVVSEITDIINRDVFIVENYERRNGFDVILKLTDEKIRNVDYFDKVRGITAE